MPRYMLDTNIASHAVRLHPTVMEHLTRMPMDQLFISAVTAGEMFFGLSKRSNPKRDLTVRELFSRVTILPWDDQAAEHYGTLRAALESNGRPLASFDTMIAAHAFAEKMILVTNDQAFLSVPDLTVVDWTKS